MSDDALFEPKLKVGMYSRGSVGIAFQDLEKTEIWVNGIQVDNASVFTNVNNMSELGKYACVTVREQFTNSGAYAIITYASQMPSGGRGTKNGDFTSVIIEKPTEGEALEAYKQIMNRITGEEYKTYISPRRYVDKPICFEKHVGLKSRDGEFISGVIQGKKDAWEQSGETKPYQLIDVPASVLGEQLDAMVKFEKFPDLDAIARGDYGWPALAPDPAFEERISFCRMVMNTIRDFLLKREGVNINDIDIITDEDSDKIVVIKGNNVLFSGQSSATTFGDPSAKFPRAEITYGDQKILLDYDSTNRQPCLSVGQNGHPTHQIITNFLPAQITEYLEQNIPPPMAVEVRPIPLAPELSSFDKTLRLIFDFLLLREGENTSFPIANEDDRDATTSTAKRGEEVLFRCVDPKLNKDYRYTEIRFDSDKKLITLHQQNGTINLYPPHDQGEGANNRPIDVANLSDKEIRDILEARIPRKEKGMVDPVVSDNSAIGARNGGSTAAKEDRLQKGLAEIKKMLVPNNKHKARLAEVDVSYREEGVFDFKDYLRIGVAADNGGKVKIIEIAKKLKELGFDIVPVKTNTGNHDIAHNYAKNKNGNRYTQNEEGRDRPYYPESYHFTVTASDPKMTKALKEMLEEKKVSWAKKIQTERNDKGFLTR